MSTFKDTVYALARKIPQGKVVTYGQLAELAGSPRAARAVGLCMKTNPDAPHTPCHRVVACDGSLVGYSAEGGVTRKKQMLESEGVVFKQNKVNLTASKWNPSSKVL